MAKDKEKAELVIKKEAGEEEKNHHQLTLELLFYLVLPAPLL